MRQRVLVTSYYDPAATDIELKRLEPVADVSRTTVGRRLEPTELIEHLEGINVVLISDELIDASVLEAAPELRMVCADGVGVDNVEMGEATAHGVMVNNAPFVHHANGDFTIGLILAVMRCIVVGDRGVRGGKWNERHRYVGRDLSASTLGLLGFGRAAQAVALRASGFGSQVIAYCRHPDRAAADRLGVQIVSFDELLARSDVLSLHVILTDETRGMVGPEQIEKMKDRAYLINTSRGTVVDQAALVAALQKGKLAGAGIDVYDTEPPPGNHSLLGMDNVVATPHMASDSFDAFRAVFKGAVDDILLYLHGQQPTHVRNPDVFNHPNFEDLKKQ